jgi:hypothetical protein
VNNFESGSAMKGQRKIYRQISLLSLVGVGLVGVGLVGVGLVGVGLVGVTFFVPDAGGHPGSFFRVAMQTTWQNLLDWPVAWCSLKIILLSVGLFLIIESTGTVLAVKQFKLLVLPVFLM